MWLYLSIAIVLSVCALGSGNGDLRGLIATTSSGCVFKQYERLYFYGAIIKSQKNVADIDQCITKCWKFVIAGARRCQAINYVKTDKRCEFMHQEFNVTNRILVMYFGDRNPNAVYAVPIFCPADQTTTMSGSTAPTTTAGSDSHTSTSIAGATSTAAAQSSTSAAGAEGSTTAAAAGSTTTAGAGSFTCGKTDKDPMGGRRSFHRIVGGTEPAKHSIPWLVSIRQGYSRKKHICGGTLIYNGDSKETDIMITAAHCVKDEFEEDAIEIVAGGHNLKGTEGEVKVEYSEAVIHDNYNSKTKENDIAIIKLKTPIQFNSHIQPACLPPAGEQLADGTQGLVAGWGRLEDRDDAPASDILQQLIVPVVNSDKCLEMYKDVPEGLPRFSDAKMMMCAGYPEGKRDSCQGDSGGPLFFKNAKGLYTLQGVVSFGYGCAKENKPGVYARVPTYIDWINGQMKKMSGVAMRR